MISKSDSEPAILALKEAARRETSVEIIREEAPVGDHQANGVAENAVKNVQGQFRVLRGALEQDQPASRRRSSSSTVDGNIRGDSNQQGQEKR